MLGDNSSRPGSFLQLLKHAARPQDYVVVKVDIEQQLRGGPELDIVRRIARDPDLAALVDEIFFEYHFWFDGLNFGWGHYKPAVMGTVDDAIKL